MADDEWFFRIDGQVDGPLTTRALKTMAALGDLIPSDEIRKGLDGPWQLARFVKGLSFKSSERNPAPPVDLRPEKPSTDELQYRYKMVQIPPTLLISAKAPKTTIAATYLEKLVNEEANAGWEFYRIDTIGLKVQPGCLGAIGILFTGFVPPVESYYVVTFRRMK